MYDFVDVNEKITENNRLPSEALFINGQAVEDVVEGYRTLTVEGRELHAYELNTTRRTSGDGSIYLGETYPPRTLTIQYELKATDNQDYRMKFEKLNRLLSGGEKELRFNDDYNYSFTGALSDVSEVPAGKNTVIGTFSFFCSDPFKYADLQVVEGKSPKIIYDDTFPIKPDYINVTFLQDVDDFTLTSGDKKIKIFPFSFLMNDTLPIDFIDNSIDEGYYEVMEYLNLDSDFEDFYIQSGVPIELNRDATLEIGYRRKAL